MSDRFFSRQPITSEYVTLDGPEAHHLLHVMRAKVGQHVMLFDGDGAEFNAEIVKCGRADVELRIESRRDVDRELPFELVVGVSLPKGDRQKWLVEKLTELGVTQLVPLETERGVAQPIDSALERLRAERRRSGEAVWAESVDADRETASVDGVAQSRNGTSSRRSTPARMPSAIAHPNGTSLAARLSPRHSPRTSPSAQRAASPTPKWPPPSPLIGKASTSASEFFASKRRLWRWRQLSPSRLARRLE